MDWWHEKLLLLDSRISWNLWTWVCELRVHVKYATRSVCALKITWLVLQKLEDYAD